MKLNPGIRRLVKWLNAMGFKTVGSGDGRTHDFGCDRDHAYVVIRVEPEKLVAEADRLSNELYAIGIIVEAQSEELHPCIQATYDPLCSEMPASLDLMNVTDEMMPP